MRAFPSPTTTRSPARPRASSPHVTEPVEQQHFADRISLQQVDRDIFTGWCHSGAPLRAYGGQIAAQALMAAGRDGGSRNSWMEVGGTAGHSVLRHCFRMHMAITCTMYTFTVCVVQAEPG